MELYVCRPVCTPTLNCMFWRSLCLWMGHRSELYCKELYVQSSMLMDQSVHPPCIACRACTSCKSRPGVCRGAQVAHPGIWWPLHLHGLYMYCTVSMYTEQP